MAEELTTVAAPVSTEFYSAHIESLRKTIDRLDENDEQAKVEAEIEASKVHWSELTSSYFTSLDGPAMDSSLSTSQPKWLHKEGTTEWKLEVAEDNVRVFRSLQKRYPGGFFLDENDLGPDPIQQTLPPWMRDGDGTCPSIEFRLSSDTPFAEGSQAELFYAHMITIGSGEKDEDWVMKVFREGTSMRDLLRCLPPTMLGNDESCTEGVFGDRLNSCNPIAGARLLKSTRRFAFLMIRAWGDLRKLIDRRMLHLNSQDLPFPEDVALHIIYEIAKGMQSLHVRGIIHRDLKAANVLIIGYKKEDCIIDIFPVKLEPQNFMCWVADYECSTRVEGTRFWRAPEILEGVKNKNTYQKLELFTKYSDVYSFGMTCYEILSGGIPLEELPAYDYDSVIGGIRPKLPSQIAPWMVNLVNRCWEKNPSTRPSFEEIMKIIYDHLQVP